jgi:hypothetical protein
MVRALCVKSVQRIGCTISSRSKLVTTQDLSDELSKYVQKLFFKSNSYTNTKTSGVTLIKTRKLAVMIEGKRTVAGGVTESTYAAKSCEARAANTAPAAHANLPCTSNPSRPKKAEEWPITGGRRTKSSDDEVDLALA